MEDIYAVNLNHIPESQFLITLKVIIQEMFKKEWDAAAEQFAELNMSAEELAQYRAETQTMMHNFFHYLVDRLKLTGKPLKEAFASEQPEREVRLQSDHHGVMGYADAIQQEGSKILILDYKTSKKAEITDDYRLQLSIYGMLYEELAKLPDDVGIFFLKHGRELRIPMTPLMASRAKEEVAAVHDGTRSREIDDYPKKPSYLCKWSTGQCDFYNECFGQKSLNDFRSELVQIGKK